MATDETYMHRCIELARLGAGNVAPNPMVGALLVYHNRVIGEGYHQKYGEAHAEVNCISQAIQNGQANLISKSILYVSLEPCAHFGKTPPCADLIINHKIPKVIIGCRDPFREVNGRGIEKLRAAGVDVELGILENECIALNKRFLTFHTLHRPYIILKWAQTANGKIAGPTQTLPEREGFANAQSPLNEDDQVNRNILINEDSELMASPSGESRKGARLFITNEFTNRLVHKWRSEEAAILIGTNTAMMDDPELTTRLWKGNNPIRLIVDMDLKLPSSLKIFNGQQLTIIFNTKVHSEESEWSFPSPLVERAGVRVRYYQLTEDTNLVHQITKALYQLQIQSVMVEGGAKLLQSFIDEGTWDEARIIKNEELIISNGLHAPDLVNASKIAEENIFSDKIEVYKPLS